MGRRRRVIDDPAHADRVLDAMYIANRRNETMKIQREQMIRPNTVLSLGGACLLSVVLTACTDSEEPPRRLEEPHVDLPGDRYHPEGLAIDSSGNMYIGSVGTGEVLRLDRDALVPERLVAPGSGEMTAAVGLVVDEAADTLWVCSADVTFMKPNSLESFNLSTGTPIDSFPLPDGQGICNDLVRDPRGNLYVTDSITGCIHRLAAGGSALEVWSADPAFAPAAPGEFTINGAGFDPSSNSLYVVKTSTGDLFRVPLDPSGAAGAAEKIALDRQLRGPDGLRVFDDSTLFVVEEGKLARVDLMGDLGSTTVVADGLEQPSGLVIDGDHVWVAEGQIPRLIGFDMTARVLPFRLQRVAIE
jgi:sugar lactone lactonase YvrE